MEHLDGTPVSGDHPARSGELLMAFAFGLGKTTPLVASGVASPLSLAEVRTGLTVVFDFTPNAAPLAAVPSKTPRPGVAPAFAGLVPGLVGLYQVNFEVPLAPENIPVCSESVKSNLTVTLLGLTSSGGAGLRVSP